ncbi:MAG: hypothetical protein RJA44_1145 [Pseudomonadota bacterium]
MAEDRPRRKRGARFIEIAAAAGVSTATVNRVLNERGSVSAETRTRVVAAARQLGVPRVLPDPRHGLTRFDVVLAQSPTPYFRRLELALQRIQQMLDPRILIHRHSVDPHDEARLLAALTRPGHRRDGLIVALHDSPLIRAELHAQLARGVPVATLMSRISPAAPAVAMAADAPPALLPLQPLQPLQPYYAGIDNLAAGRTAGHFIGRLARRPGRVLLLTHTLGYRAHAERMQGCADALAERHPHLQATAPVECHDDPDRCQLALEAALLQARRDEVALVGLYHSGAGASGLARVLQRLTPAERPVWIAHELSDEHRPLLRLGLMDLLIDQDPDGQVAASLHHLLHATGYVEQPPPGDPNEFRLFGPENLPGETPYLDAPLKAPVERLRR